MSIIHNSVYYHKIFWIKNKSLLLLMSSKKRLSESLSEIKETAQYAGILVLSCFSALWLWVRRKRIK